MRLTNEIEEYGGFRWRIILDSLTPSTNYIERTRGVYYSNGDHFCIKCLKAVLWMDWISEHAAKGKCKCGERQTLEIMSCGDRATVLSTEVKT